MNRNDSAAASPRLAVRGLQCRRGERTLFERVDFSVGSGEIVWLRGANGQGKTTLLRTLAGLSAPEAGTIAWGGESARPAPVYLAHANGLKEDLTAIESLRFLLRVAGDEATESELDAALARFGMASRRDAPVRTLSQGQRRRVALARLAIAREPTTWLLDEPFDALDASGIDTLNGVLVAQSERGGSIVLTSHVPLAIQDPQPVVVMLESPVAA
jgi:heme exporter protein A